jgi:ABC-type transporter Mla subunit MlaD
LRRLIGIAAAATLLVACGTSGDPLSRADYQDELDQATGAVEQAFTQLGESLQDVSADKGSLEDVAGEVANIQDELDSAADELDDVSPPEDVVPAHDKLVDGMRGISDDLEDLKSALEEGDAAALQRIGATFEDLDSAKLLEQATNELEKAGYKLGG